MAERKIKRLSTIEVLQTLNDGGTIDDLNDAIREVSRAVNERGGSGTVTLKLKISKKKSRNAIEIFDAVSKTVPAPVKDATTFFTLEDGRLTRDNPEQPGFVMDEQEIN